MSLNSYCGLPGTGKTSHCVYDGRKHFKSENRFINTKILVSNILLKYLPNCKLKDNIQINMHYRSLFPHMRVNNVYSTLPIVLDKKRGIEANKLHLDDLNGTFSFLPNSVLIIDETQLFYDSDEYRNQKVNKQLSRIGQFCQAHRHFGVKNIIWTSQNPNRIFKKGREVSVWFYKHKTPIKIPFTNYSIGRATAYEDLDYYGKWIPIDREERRKLPFEYKNHLWLFNRNHVYNSYDDKYLRHYNHDKPLLNRGTWLGKSMTVDELTLLFDLNKDKTIDISEQLENTPSSERLNIYNEIQ